MRVLVTNDDGIRATGIHMLARAIRALGHDVVIVAPEHEMSGSSSSMGPLAHADHVRYREVSVDGLAGVPAYAIDGPPALCVIAAASAGFGPAPDIVVSGINPGLNCGRATLHSGTVGAALTAAHWGFPALAVSIESGDVQHWDTAATFAQVAFQALAADPMLDAGHPLTDGPMRGRRVVNVNVPNRPLADVRGLRHATLAPLGAVRTVITGRSSDRLLIGHEPVTEELPEGSDTRLVKGGYVAVTFLSSVASVDALAAQPTGASPEDLWWEHA
jgi:5'-nucleotidase